MAQGEVQRWDTFFKCKKFKFHEREQRLCKIRDHSRRTVYCARVRADEIKVQCDAEQSSSVSPLTCSLYDVTALSYEKKSLPKQTLCYLSSSLLVIGRIYIQSPLSVDTAGVSYGPIALSLSVVTAGMCPECFKFSVKRYQYPTNLPSASLISAFQAQKCS